MNGVSPSQPRGFSLIEVLIAMAISTLVMASVFVLLSRSRETFRREPEVSDMNANARSGLDQISQELTVAGFATPPNMAVAWTDGGGITPDQITILYADSEIPVARPARPLAVRTVRPVRAPAWPVARPATTTACRPERATWRLVRPMAPAA